MKMPNVSREPTACRRPWLPPLLACSTVFGACLTLAACSDGREYPAAPQPEAPVPRGAAQVAALVRDPASGHYYQRVDARVSWADARLAAERMTFQGVAGHLVTIGSQEENDFVFSLFVQQPGGYRWLGASQPVGGAARAGGWQWVEDGPLRFSNWSQGAPNELRAIQSALALNAGGPDLGRPGAGKWTNLPADGGPTPPLGYVVEFDAADGCHVTLTDVYH